MRKKRITVVSFNSSGGLIYQRAHIPFRHLSDIYEFNFVDLNEIRHIDFFYTDLLVMVHPWSMDFAHLASRARYHYQLPVIVDLDDLLMDLPIDHPDYSNINGKPLVDTLQMATEVVYSTPYLKAKLGHLNRHATVIENTIPEHTFKQYKAPNKPYKTTFTVGWTGGQSHRSDILYTFEAGLKQFLIENDDARAHFHGLCPQELQRALGAQVYFEPAIVDYMDYHAICETYPFDVCLVGLLDHSFNHAKSDLRLIDMAPHDIPLIASPRSDFYKHRDKKIMLYAEDNSDQFMSWKQALEYAKANPEEMKAMAARAKAYVLEERLSTVAAEKWFNVIERAIAKNPAKSSQVGRSLLAHSLELHQLD